MPVPFAELPKKTLHHLVTIDAWFGSRIQRDVAMKVLGEFLNAWKVNVESSHKKNKVTVGVQKDLTT
jgi:hypothetical protein